MTLSSRGKKTLSNRIVAKSEAAVDKFFSPFDRALNSREAKFQKKSLAQLKKGFRNRSIASAALTFGPPFLGVPILSMLDLSGTAGFIGFGAVVGSMVSGLGVFFLGALPYSDAGDRREKLERANALHRWRQDVAEKLSSRFAVELTAADVENLNYPLEDPEKSQLVRYGTIQKLLKDSEDNISLEKVTLIWDENEFKLLRDATNLRELNGKALA